MTIIDKYIQTHIKQPAWLLAQQIGVSETFVEARKELMQVKALPSKYPMDVQEEVTALLKLIEVRKTGWAVDIAKERIRKLEKSTTLAPFF